MNTAVNRLASQSSPYLLQHADNPVHWQPWDAEALAEAARSDRPILLSIGYSACHWCHVMAHESFEDEKIAELMNRLYVNIKVDREERPDLDRIYQVCHQLLTRRAGGWPLTVILTPRGHAPIFAGTYFPREPRPGMPTFRRVLTEVESHYRANRQAMDEHDEAMRYNLQRIAVPAPGARPDDDAADHAATAMLEYVDPRHGGFGGAPKFPHASALSCLLDAAYHYPADAGDLRAALTLSLDNMISGGLFDQVGGGFFRYSVDDAWQIPHFEKMLYDNALLMPLYAAAGRELDNGDWRAAAVDTATWALREMQLAHGGFCSSLDADSDGGEGRFYLWARGEIDTVLDGNEAAVARALFGTDRPPNFEDRHHLCRARRFDAAARHAGLSGPDADDAWHRARVRLLAHRDERPRPDRDEKCLTAWNAMMIRALARTGRLLGRADFVDVAERALAYLSTHHADGDRLHAVSRDGRAHLSAYLDDYVYLADALLELLQYRWRPEDLDWCVRLVEQVLDRFEDPAGGFYFTANDHEALLHRPKIAADDSTPSGNGIAAQVLLEVGHLLGETRYLDAAESVLTAFSGEITANPVGHAALLEALIQSRHPPTRVVLRGEDSPCAERAARLALRYGRRVRVYPLGSTAADVVLAGRGFTAPRGVVAWVCTGSRCLAPITELPSLLDTIDETLQ